MDPSWPARGPWLITATSTATSTAISTANADGTSTATATATSTATADATSTATSAATDWRIAAAALAVAADVPVAAMMVGNYAGDEDPVRPHLAGVLQLPVADRLTLEHARDLVMALSAAYEIVLFGAGVGPLVPLGQDGWTLADLARVVRAQALVVTGAGPDAVNHITLALGALAGHGIAAAVVTVGEVDEADEAALPVKVAGRIPADPPADFTGAADWFDPMLRATTGPARLPAPAESSRSPVDGKRIVLGLLAVFLIMVAVVCGLAWWGSSPVEEEYRVSISRSPASRPSATVAPVPFRSPRAAGSSPLVSRRTADRVCPQYGGRVAATSPDAATTARVNAAWRRIEKWLAARAPASARALRPPAPAARVADLQRRMSVAFPADLVVSLRRHDGVSELQDILPPFYAPATMDDIFAEWQGLCDVSANADTSWTDAWWDRAFVPFAKAGDGGSLVVDQRPGGHGRVGEFFAENGTSFERWPASVAELLELTAASLETGQPYAGSYRPRVDADGSLDWEIQ